VSVCKHNARHRSPLPFDINKFSPGCGRAQQNDQFPSCDGTFDRNPRARRKITRGQVMVCAGANDWGRLVAVLTLW